MLAGHFYWHALLNLMGQAIPLLAAVWSIPILLKALGPEHFGLLTLAWAIMSALALADFGLGRAITQRIASRPLQALLPTARLVHSTALSLMFAAGLIAGGLVSVTTFLCSIWISTSPSTQETYSAALWLAASLPAITLTTGLRAILEGRSAFGWVNALRVPINSMVFIAPVVAVSTAPPSIEAVCASLFVVRWIGCALHALVVKGQGLTATAGLAYRARLVSPLVRAGGWFGLIALSGPLIGYGDRFIVASIGSLEQAACYATPHELVTKIWIVPAALSMALFPALAVRGSPSRTDMRGSPLVDDSSAALFVILLPATLSLSLFSQELLSSWISPQFADCSAKPLRWFSLGILFSCLAFPASTFLQASGRAQVVAAVQLGQVLPFLGLMTVVTSHYGVEGAAALWAARAAVDMVVLMILSRSGPFRPGPRPLRWSHVILGAACMAGFLVPADYLSGGTRALLLTLSSGLAWAWQGKRFIRLVRSSPVGSSP